MRAGARTRSLNNRSSLAHAMMGPSANLYHPRAPPACTSGRVANPALPRYSRAVHPRQRPLCRAAPGEQSPWGAAPAVSVITTTSLAAGDGEPAVPPASATTATTPAATAATNASAPEPSGAAAGPAAVAGGGGAVPWLALQPPFTYMVRVLVSVSVLPVRLGSALRSGVCGEGRLGRRQGLASVCGAATCACVLKSTRGTKQKDSALCRVRVFVSRNTSKQLPGGDATCAPAGQARGTYSAGSAEVIVEGPMLEPCSETDVQCPCSQGGMAHIRGRYRFAPHTYRTRTHLYLHTPANTHHFTTIPAPALRPVRTRPSVTPNPAAYRPCGRWGGRWRRGRRGRGLGDPRVVVVWVCRASYTRVVRCLAGRMRCVRVYVRVPPP